MYCLLTLKNAISTIPGASNPDAKIALDPRQVTTGGRL